MNTKQIKKVALLNKLVKGGATFGEKQAAMVAIVKITGDELVQFRQASFTHRFTGRAGHGFTISRECCGYFYGEDIVTWDETILTSSVEEDVKKFQSFVNDTPQGVILYSVLQKLFPEYFKEIA